ncbi:hypothetical protein BDB00DRAFT_819365 [Zychaea mexicana]|uniref:uncharacterized protein n=1 Tax=Zychaea mexicana TaxID=64656 RepID=UPI0022FF453B|nr:uncharacterized protein BDB00DRAFT_819365 [Zychaea mexicana]KAI9494236.1 hypothetical protein BDB00DRAFT_819365 [Zychaea mexicana]
MPSIPKNTSLYEILQLDQKTATTKEIKSQYRKLALKFHPDKQSASATDQEKQDATEQFQQLGLAYSILSDPAKKSHYDTTGSISTDDSLKGDKSWNDYFKELWSGVVSEETIDKFAAKYKGSDEERNDVLQAYKSCKGDMDKILNFVECSDANDGERFMTIIRKAIDEGKVPTFPSFSKTTTGKAHQKRIKEQERREKEWDKKHKGKKAAKKGGDEDSDLLAMIQARQKDRASHLDALADKIAEKAGKSSSKKRGRVQDDEPSEEEFQRIRAGLMKNKGEAASSTSNGSSKDEQRQQQQEHRKRAKKNTK